MPLSARQSPLAGRDAAGRGMTETDFAKRDPGNPDPAGFGVYVHWPFCASKCPYCDFNSHVRAGGVDQADYLEAYRREIADAAARTGPRKVASIFFGGGTPSLMAPATVSGILDAIANAWHIAAEAEITLEANPSSVEADRFEAYRSAGIAFRSASSRSSTPTSWRWAGFIQRPKRSARSTSQPTLSSAFPST